MKKQDLNGWRPEILIDLNTRINRTDLSSALGVLPFLQTAQTVLLSIVAVKPQINSIPTLFIRHTD